MSEPPSRPSPANRHKSLLERLSSFIFREPENREELLRVLHDAHERDLLDADALSMIEGVLQVSELRAGDLMIPTSQMDVIDLGDAPETWLPFAIRTGHSRFPVIEGSRDQVIGILLAKDLLRYYTEPAFSVRDNLRAAVFIPESKPINVLLRDFRANRNHIAIVVDEYGGVAGLITIEDVLEQIVGDIEDEYDLNEGDDAILPDGDPGDDTIRYRVKALTEIEQFNEVFGTNLSDAAFDTIGGFLTEQFGRVPKRGDSLVIDDIRFEVLRADARRPLLFQVTRTAKKTVAQEFAEAHEQQHSV
jgi:magnesium and cobalt transporter